MAWVSWGKLVHPIFDTGQEMEIAARLLQGQVLYRDVLSNYTPLAYYVNAFFLLLFGHNLAVFYTIGLGLALTVTLLGYQLVRQLTNAPWAALCAGYILIYCAFNPGGLLNLAAPYSYGAVYATIFWLVALMAVDRYGRTENLVWLAIAACGAGLAGLAKQEFGVAAVTAIVVGVNLRPTKNSIARIGRTLAVIFIAIGCVLLPLAVLADRSSWQAITAALLPLNKTQIFIDSGLFYFTPARTLSIWGSLLGSFLATNLVTSGAIVVARVLIDRLTIADRRLKYITELFSGVALAWCSLFLLQIPLGAKSPLALLAISLAIAIGWKLLDPQARSDWSVTKLLQLGGIGLVICIGILVVRRFGVISEPLRNLAWLLPLLTGWFVVRWRSLRQHPQAVILWSLLTFAVVLNSRFWFNIDFYGIYAVTSILLLFVLLYQLACHLRLQLWNYLLIGLLLGGGMQIAKFSQYRYPISSSHGTMYVNRSELADAYNYAISYIDNSGAKSVLTLPTGAILNFLTATHSPSPETLFLPGVLPTANAERQFVANMQQHPPDLIIYVDVPFSWLKPDYQKYARFNPIVDKWIGDRYQLVHSSTELSYDDRPWILRIYAPKHSATRSSSTSRDFSAQ
jgi:Dolichyl-phosphate-mannose-protein mannosyltransferase